MNNKINKRKVIKSYTIKTTKSKKIYIIKKQKDKKARKEINKQ